MGIKNKNFKEKEMQFYEKLLIYDPFRKEQAEVAAELGINKTVYRKLLEECKQKSNSEYTEIIIKYQELDDLLKLKNHSEFSEKLKKVNY